MTSLAGTGHGIQELDIAVANMIICKKEDMSRQNWESIWASYMRE